MNIEKEHTFRHGWTVCASLTAANLNKKEEEERRDATLKNKREHTHTHTQGDRRLNCGQSKIFD